MKQPFRFVILVFTHALAVVTGIAAGYWLVSSNADFVDETALVSRAAAYVTIQRSQGGDEDYESALLTFLEVIVKYKNDPRSFFEPKPYAIDSTFTYVRLARLAEETGDLSSINEYTKKALMSCEGTGWEDCSKESLWAVVVRLDEPSQLGKTQEY